VKYNLNNYRKVMKEYEQRLSKEKEDAAKRKEELYGKFPEFAQIDTALMSTSLKIMTEITRGGTGLEERMEMLRKENKELQAARAEFLRQNGYPSDYTDIRYSCENCRDTGFKGTEMCECLKRELVMAGYESSGMKNLMKGQSFDTFSLDYYINDKKADLKTMKHNFEYCKKYAEDFPDTDHKNLIFTGDTGLGKTHLSTSIAKVVIDRGYDVVYTTAQDMFADFEYERFGNNSYGNDSDELARGTSKYFNCELLIIDDLGTEIANQFTIACLYNVVNTRMNKEKSMIINTNFSGEELRSRYSDRITSRLFGEFVPLKFSGNDIRMKKISQNKKTEKK